MKEYKVFHLYEHNTSDVEELQNLLNAGWNIDRSDVMPGKECTIVYILSKENKETEGFNTPIDYLTRSTKG